MNIGDTKITNISGAPNMERLILSDCRSLVGVHESVGSHRRLVYLDMNGCIRLKHLPSRLEMESLETLILSRCFSLKRFPEVSPRMVKLSVINLFFCSRIKELQSSVGYFSSLHSLNLTHCWNLENILNSICESQYRIVGLNMILCRRVEFVPTIINLYYCSGITELPSLCYLFCLEIVYFTDCSNLEPLQEFTYDTGRPQKSVGLKSLSSVRKLNLSWVQIGEESFSTTLDAFSSLEELNLSGNSKLVHLPSIISHFSRLKLLELNECSRLESLCMLPSSIQVLKANDCNSLKKIGDVSTGCTWLYKLCLINCQKLLEDEENQRYLDKMLQQSFIKKCAVVNHRLSIIVPGSKIPSWFKEEKNGCRIALDLPHKWDSEIMGFVVSGVFHGKQWKHAFPHIIFRISNDGKVIPKSEVDYTKNATKIAENGNVWISYIPLGFFQQMCHDLQPEDWSHIEGILDMTVMLTDGTQSVRCGAHVIYKQDVQQITTCISDYGNVVHVDDEDLVYEVVSGNTYVLEEKSDDKSLMPLRCRTSTMRSTKSAHFAATSSADSDDESL